MISFDSIVSLTWSPPQKTNRLKRLIAAAPVVLFMKGSPAQPRCGFSSKMVDLLKGEVRREGKY